MHAAPVASTRAVSLRQTRLASGASARDSSASTPLRSASGRPPAWPTRPEPAARTTTLAGG